MLKEEGSEAIRISRLALAAVLKYSATNEQSRIRNHVLVLSTNFSLHSGDN